MTDHEHVLTFGDDGSPSSDAAWLWISNHAWPGWHLDRRTVSTVTVKALGPVRDVSPIERTPFAESAFAGQTSAFVDGDPRVVLAGVTDSDLVVVGSRGTSTWRGAWVGSTTTWLMQEPAVPLAVVRHGGRTTRVLVAADGSPHADAAVAALLALPWIAHLEVVVASVDDGRSDAAAAAASTAARLEGSVASVRTEVLTGRVTDALVELIDSSKADLAVLGTRGLTGWERIRVGSTAAAVVHHASCNALLACATKSDGQPEA